MSRNIRVFLIILAILGVYDEGFSATTINSLPYNINSSGEYIISQDLSISSGAGITINANNVSLDGNSNAIRISRSGDSTGILVDNNVDNFEVYNLTITQENSEAGSECIKIEDGATGIKMHDLTLNVVGPGSSGETWGIDDRSTGSSNYIQNSSINITGGGSYKGIESHDTPLTVSGCTFTTIDTQLIGNYPFVMLDVGGPIHDNTFHITGEKVNVIGFYGTDDVHTYNNTINYNCSEGGRIIHLDNGTSGHRVYNNKITILSNNTGSTSQYGIRVRTDRTQPTKGHLIYSNTVDATGVSGKSVYAFALGGGSGETVSGIRIYDNHFKSVHPVFYFYNDNLNDVDLYCNKMEAKSSAYGVSIGNRVGGTDIKFGSNDITSERSDGKLIYVTAAAAGVKFCSADINASDIVGGGSVSYSSSLCDTWSCSGSPGADGADVPSPPLLPPENLHIVDN